MKYVKALFTVEGAIAMLVGVAVGSYLHKRGIVVNQIPVIGK